MQPVREYLRLALALFALASFAAACTSPAERRGAVHPAAAERRRAATERPAVIVRVGVDRPAARQGHALSEAEFGGDGALHRLETTGQMFDSSVARGSRRRSRWTKSSRAGPRACR